MSGGNNKRFRANPVSWLRSNVLIVDLQSQTQTASDEGLDIAGAKHRQGALLTCNIIQHPRDTAVSANGHSVSTYAVVEATGPASKYSHRFSAYYLPFFNNDYRVMRLDPTTFPPGADYFFTDSVNGCSFAAGPGAAPKVGHFNRTTGDNDMADQPAMDLDIQGEFAMGTAVKLTKATYKGTSVSKAASVIGIRTTAGWDFYWQGRDINGYNHPVGTQWHVPNNMLTQCDNNG